MQTNIRRTPITINLDDDDQVDAAIKTAVQDGLREHRRRGESVVVWQDGKIVQLSPEELLVDEAN